MTHHPCTASWVFPPGARDELGGSLRRTNLRELAARPGRFEHHLVVVGSVAGVQLEIPTASEPVPFAHVNLSDELVVAMPTGDPMIDGFPFRVFVSDPQTGEDLTRIQHRVGELVLHPEGYSHFPGKLRPPFDAPKFPPNMRRTGLTLVCCAATKHPAHPQQPLGQSEGLEGRVKHYGAEPPPSMLRVLASEPAGVVGRVGDTVLELLVDPESVAPPRGGYVVLLQAGAPHFACDLIYIPPGASLPGAGIERALLLHSVSTDVDSPPDSWQSVAAPPFARYEDAPAGTLPLTAGGITLEEKSPTVVAVRIGDSEAQVPRHWLCRLLYRVALHGYRLGYVETYGGFYHDDTSGTHRLGIRGGDAVEVPAEQLPALVETLYRAAGYPGYTEELVP